MSTNPSLLTLRQAAGLLGVHESTVRRYADRGLIGSARLPSGVRRLHRADVDALARRMGNGAPGEEEQLAKPVGIGDFWAPLVWDCDEELEEFLTLTYAERDRDR
jgi:excisionase family DNA binding protein